MPGPNSPKPGGIKPRFAQQPGKGEAGMEEMMSAMAGAQGQSGSTSGGASGSSSQIGSLADELIKKPVKDIVTGVKEIFDINSLLGINPQTDDPEKQAKKKQMHQNWMRLNADQQQYAQRRYQELQQKKQVEEQQEQIQKQQHEAAKADAVLMPTSIKKGPVGPAAGNKKKSAANQLKQQRTTLGTMQNVG